MALLALALVAACSSDRGEPEAVRLSDLLLDRVRQVGQPAPQPAPLPPRALIDARTDPLLLIEIPGRGARATVTPIARNEDSVTWLAPDGITVTTRQGLLVATRGLGDDLMSADVSQVRAALPGGGRATRVHYYLDGENRTRRLVFDCRLTQAGATTLEIVERRYPTRRVDETCRGEGIGFTNSYWLDAGSGTVRQSRQWLGPRIDAATTRLLSD